MINRSRIEIMAHILTFCARPRLKTQIMYNANITFGQFATYETLLLSRGLLACATDRYWATEKGNRFVEAFSQLQSTLENASPRTIPLENLSRSGKADLWPKK